CETKTIPFVIKFFFNY
ncbi:unnamed protein product, partial [Rotaria sordida]